MFGSFVNALVWRLHMQASRKQKVESKKSNNLKSSDLSIIKGRSMCPGCKHELSAKDLVPVFSWLTLGGRCRYCKKPISWQYPLVELFTAFLFVFSFFFWPLEWNTYGVINFVVWLIIIVGFMSLIIYDLKWMLLPNRIVFPLIVISVLLAVFNILSNESLSNLYQTVMSVAVAGGIFYLLFVISGGKWIGGGDVKLGLLIGLILGDPYLAFLVLFIASLLGTLYILPGILLKRVNPRSRIPFGPFLIMATIIVQLFGLSLVEWYKSMLYLEV